jgi:hypothetical protein
MTDFLSSLKDDLLDRRVLPLVALVGVALAAALAYAVLGGSGSAATVAVNPTGPVHAPGIIVTPSPTNPDQPVAETTSGTTHQRRGLSRNPFNLLVAPAKLRTGAAGAVGRTGSLTTSVGAGTSPTSPGGPGWIDPDAPLQAVEASQADDGLPGRRAVRRDSGRYAATDRAADPL